MICAAEPFRDVGGYGCNDALHMNEGESCADESAASEEETLHPSVDPCEGSPLEQISIDTETGENTIDSRILEVDHVAVEKLRTWLQENGVDSHAEAHVLTDAYLHMCLTQLKDGKPRAFEYTANKLLASMKWRERYGASTIQLSDVANAMAPGHMYWDGLDRLGRPILFVRPAMMDLKTYNREEYVRAHVFLLEQGLRLMPPGVTKFLLVADATGLGMRHFDASLMRALLGIVTEGYPDRLGLLLVGPMNTVVRLAWAVLSRLMSRRMAAKIRVVKSLRPALSALLPGPGPAGPGPDLPPWLP